MPRWGGVLIRNPDTQETGAEGEQQVAGGQEQRLVVSDLHPAMEVFIAQLRSLIGVKPLQEIVQDRSKITFASSLHSGLTLWELDALIRKNTYHSLVKSANTLQSLASMVEQITNMVIEDKIQALVLASLDHIRSAKRQVISGDYLGAIHHAKEGLRLAERAFFDPNMVAMLYFPDDHKYAIYIPLYLPVSMPLVFALANEAKQRLGKKEPTK